MIKDFRLIALNYLRSWFFPDLLGCDFPAPPNFAGLKRKHRPLRL